MTETPNAQTTRTTVQKGALLVGVVFLLVGILGFIPGVTTNYNTMSFASHHSEAMLLGLFQVSILHNIVHLLFGVAGLVASRTVRLSRGYLIAGGVIYLILFVYGILIDKQSAANFVPLNTADDILHVVLGAGMIILGLLLTPRDRAKRAATA